MKKRDLSKFVIAITIITIILLLYIKYFIVNNYINGFKGVESIKIKEEVENIDSFKINEECIVYKSNINDFKEEVNESNKKEDVDESNKKESLEKEEIKQIGNKNNVINNNYSATSINNKNKNIDNSDIDKEKSVQVFKTDKNKLISEVSFKDKLTIFTIVKNLSSNEYKELLNNIKRNDELDAAVDIFTILKDNLSKEDYNELKEIAEPYLNIEVIEENIR